MSYRGRRDAPWSRLRPPPKFVVLQLSVVVNSVSLVLELWPATEAVVVKDGGLVLREWVDDDCLALVHLFDTPEMDLRTPLASPFGLDAARQYVDAAHRVRRELGALQLAITTDGSTPLGDSHFPHGDHWSG